MILKENTPRITKQFIFLFLTKILILKYQTQ